MLGNSILVDRKKFFGEVCSIEIEPIKKSDIKDIKINRLQAMKSINESIKENIYKEFIKCSKNLSNTEDELIELLLDR